MVQVASIGLLDESPNDSKSADLKESASKNRSAKSLVDKPADKSADRAADKPTDKPADKPISKPADKLPDNSANAPQFEVITGPNAAKGARAPAPSWLTSDKDDEPEDEVVNTAEDISSMTAVMYKAIDVAHDKAADITHYDGWRLTPKELELWKELCAFLAKKLPAKDLPIIMVIMAVAMMEGGKGFGFYQDWRATHPKPKRQAA